jgi:hypothetical protein
MAFSRRQRDSLPGQPGGCEIILCEDAVRQDKGRLFVELNRDGIEELRREISDRSVPTQKAWWGFDVIRIVDPDGTNSFFLLTTRMIVSA